jgi:hypothetical protein
MELKMKIGLEQLIEAIKQLPPVQFVKLRAELNKVVPEKNDKEEFKSFLLQAPVFTNEQIKLMEEARKSMNQWGKS